MGTYGCAANVPGLRHQRIDVTNVVCRVTRDGYKTFEGTVTCKEADEGTDFKGISSRIAGDYRNPLAASDFDLLNCITAMCNRSDSPAMQMHRIGALLKLGLTGDARQELSAVSKASPGDPEAKYASAVVCYRSGDAEGARRMLKETLALLPHHPTANLLMAKILLDMGDKTTATHYLKIHTDFYGYGFCM